MSAASAVGICTEVPKDLHRAMKQFCLDNDGWTLSKLIRVSLMKYLGYEGGKVESAKVAKRGGVRHGAGRKSRSRPGGWLPIEDRVGYVEPKRSVPLTITQFTIPDDEPIGGFGR